MSNSRVVATGALALLVGAAGGYLVGKSSTPSTPDALPAAPALDELVEERDALALRSSELHEGVTELRKENAELRRELERVSSVKPQPEAEPAPSRDSALDAIAVAFGEVDRLGALGGARWSELATAMAGVDKAVAALAAAREAGEEVDGAVWKEIQTQNNKLRAYALGLIGKLPTNVSGNGEFTHPLSTANLLAAYLDEASLPLTDEQRDTLALLGSDYDAAFAETNASYDESTYNLEKLLDELDLKRDFHSAAFDALDQQQYDTMMVPEIRGKVRMDVLSPGVMLSRTSQSLITKSTVELRSELVKRAAKWFDRPEAEIAHLPAFDRWIRDMDPLLDPVESAMSSVYTVDDAEIAGRAQLTALQSLESSLELTEQQRQRLRNSQYLFVPRIVPASGDGG